MNLGDAKTKAIQLIEEYSVRGTLTSQAKNADFLLRMASLADYVQNEISDRVGIEAVMTIDENTAITSTTQFYNKWALPDDLKDFRHVLHRDMPYHEFRVEDKEFWVMNGITPHFAIYYNRYPTTVTNDTPDDYIFEVEPYTHTMIPYYLGGMVIADEQSEISNKLLNIFYERLNQASKRFPRYPKRVRLTTRW